MPGPGFGNFMTAAYPTGSMGQTSFASGANIKRKRQSWTAEDVETQVQKAMRCQSPKFDRRSTFPLHRPFAADAADPGLSASASDSDSADQTMMDMDGDADMSGVAGAGGPAMSGQMGQHHSMGMGMDQDMMEDGYDDAPGQEGRMGMGYNFDDRGSGGFGFGPGCEEDEEEMVSHPTALYPSFTPHTNPNHFSNQPHGGSHYNRATSPFAAQSFSTTLRAPSPRGTAAGLMQPAAGAPLPHNASEVEKARSQHGPHCKGIPKLRLSDYPDPATGERSMWSMCQDCGAIERSM